MVATGDHNIFTVENLLSGHCEDAHATRLKYYHDASLSMNERLENHILDNDATLFVVDELLALERAEQDNTLLVFVKWQGFPDEDNSWEPIGNLVRDIPARLREWLQTLPASGDVTEALSMVLP